MKQPPQGRKQLEPPLSKSRFPLNNKNVRLPIRFQVVAPPPYNDGGVHGMCTHPGGYKNKEMT